MKEYRLQPVLLWQPVSADKVKGFHLGIAASYRTPKQQSS